MGDYFWIFPFRDRARYFIGRKILERKSQILGAANFIYRDFAFRGFPALGDKMKPIKPQILSSKNIVYIQWMKMFTNDSLVGQAFEKKSEALGDLLQPYIALEKHESELVKVRDRSARLVEALKKIEKFVEGHSELTEEACIARKALKAHEKSEEE